MSDTQVMPIMDLEGQRRKSIEQSEASSDEDLVGGIVNMGRYLHDLNAESKRPHPMLLVAFDASKEVAIKRGLDIDRALSAAINH